jgi:succinate dehydrogenase / fumarate reductase flavoprotein subunit
MKRKVLIIGSGLSGSMAAIAASEKGASVSVLAHAPVYRSSASCARYGINASGDVEPFVKDTMSCGGHLASEALVRFMCASSEMLLSFLVRAGVFFDSDCEGLPIPVKSPGSGSPRTFLSGPNTGHAIALAVDGQLVRLHVKGGAELNYEWEFLSLIQDDDGAVRGAVAVNTRSMEIRAFQADAVVACTGGYEGLYKYNCGMSYADGSAIAACMRKGAILSSLEFVQFTPLGLGPLRRMPCSNLFIYGARPLSAKGDEPSVLTHVDLSHVDFSMMDRRTRRSIDRQLAHVGFDHKEGKIPVYPSAEMSLGGISVDANQATNLPGLFAAGRAAPGYHGECALSGNVMLASIYSGMRAGQCAAEYACGLARGASEIRPSVFDGARSAEEDMNSSLASQTGDEVLGNISSELSSLMQSAAGMKRSERGLDDAISEIAKLKGRFKSAPLRDRSEWANGEIIRMRRLLGKFEIAAGILLSAKARGESKGAHDTKRQSEGGEALGRLSKASLFDKEVRVEI